MLWLDSVALRVVDGREGLDFAKFEHFLCLGSTKLLYSYSLLQKLRACKTTNEAEDLGQKQVGW